MSGSLPQGAIYQHSSQASGISDPTTSGVPNDSGAQWNLFGLVAWGDNSIQAARELGPDGTPRFGELAQVDLKRTSVLGVSKTVTQVSGLR